MPLQYTSVPENDFSLGIDARSAENQIAPGFVKDLLNADIIEKRMRKRAGYQGFAGNLPARVTQVEYKQAENEICFSLPEGVSLETSGISLDSTQSSPIVVYGRTSSEFSSGDGPFFDSADNVKYYPGFSVPTRKELIAPNGTLLFPESEHSLPTTNLFVNVVESTSLANRSYSDILTDSLRINKSTFDVNIDYTTYIDRNVFVYFANETPVTGTSFVYAATGVGTGPQTISIPAGTHNLSNFNIVSSIQLDTGAERVQVEVDSFTVATNGDVTVTLTNGTGSSQDYYIILSAAPTANIVTGVVNATSTGTVTITGLTSPWIFYSIYLEQTPGGTREQVLPESFSYDDTTKSVTIFFDNEAALARNFIVFYQYGLLIANQLCVTDNTLTASGIDTRPQLSIWGLEQDEIYPAPKSEREGWVNHIDSYRRSGEQRLISGLGGNLFSARTFSEAAAQYAYAQLYPKLNSRTSTNLILGPLLWDTGETPARSRGYITADNSGTHWGSVTAVSYDSGNGWTQYTISLPTKAIFDSTGTPTSLASVISVASGLEDYLTVNQMSYRRHEGTFRIRQVQDGVNQILVWVENSSNSSDYDDSGTGGQAGVFTDEFTWASNSPYIPGDILLAEVLGSTMSSSVVSSLGTATMSDGWTDLLQIPGGVLFVGERTSNVVPLRLGYPAATSSTVDLVRGDMLSYTGIPRQVRVESINPDSDRSVNITVSGGVATVTLLSGDTSFLSSGMSVLLLQAGVYTGVQEITNVASSTSLEFSTSETVSISGALISGNTAEIDEQLTWNDTIGDTTVFTVEDRWIPIEAPDDSFDLTPSTHVRYFDFASYIGQAFLRSTMVVDNMYLTNQSDEVYKFEGSSNYRSGLPSWQPGLFLTQDTTTTARIVVDNPSSVPAAVTDNVFQIPLGDENKFSAGTRVRHSFTGGTNNYDVLDSYNDGSNGFIKVRRISTSAIVLGAAPKLTKLSVYRYYYRLNAVDVNSNIIASAVTGYQDHVIEIAEDASINHKIVGFPAWDIYDYKRLEVQIYRTKLDQVAPFYLVTTLPMSFNNTLGYLTFQDAFTDTDLTQLDIVNTALKGAELGTAWSEPLRAKYVTSIGNSLVLGNVRDYPQLDIQIVGDSTVDNSTFNGNTLLFRRDNTDALTVTDMQNRVRFQWVLGTTGTAGTYVIGSNQFSFNVSGTPTINPGDWIYLSYAAAATAGNDLTYSGWYQVLSLIGTTVTVNLVGAAAALAYPDSYTIATDATDVPVLLGPDGNLGMVNGDSFDTFDAMRRLSMAMNTVMRQVDTTLTGMSSFTPWLTARSGNDTPPGGRIIVRQERSDTTVFSCVPTFSGYSLFINSVSRASGDQISASTRVYPSRLLLGYENYPEIFDNPTSILDVDSDSAIDVNPADGQEITGVIPFFGEAAFTAAQQTSVLIVFKTNSIYLVDVNQKRLGAQSVQRIESEGLGCTAPYSISSSKGGIMFANESGIYCLRRNQAVEYLGRYMERNWTERVDLAALSIVQGHHFGLGRAYKLSVPLTSTVDSTTGYIENSEVYVYNHTGEDVSSASMAAAARVSNKGAWGRYDNHPATGWANLAADAFFASTGGRVFSIRNTGLTTDYRDDSSSINMFIETRPTDFGAPGIRKITDKIIVDYRVGAQNEGTSLLYSLDLNQEYEETQSFTVPKSISNTGLSDVIIKDITTIRHDIGRRRSIYISIQILNDTIDENVEVAGITFKVAGLSDKGILQAAQTK